MSKLTALEVKFDFGGATNTIYPVILSDEEEMVLIDCGYPNFLPLIKAEAEKEGLDISKLTKIIITHHDFDHMGALAEFKRAYPQFKVLSSIEDEKYVSGKEKSLRLQQAESIYNSLPEDQKEGGGIEVVATPGHMPGHISIYVKDSRTLIAGDALVIENEELVIANPQYTLDIEEAKESAEKLLNYDIDRVICYHGGIYTKNIKKALERI